MIDLREALPVLFYYDHSSGLFSARLPNGATIPIDRNQISGRFSNALELFKKQVIAQNSGRYVQARGARGELTYSYDESQVRKFKGKREVLPELELDLEDLI